MEVRDRRLYTDAGYPTFEKYCIGRWDFKRAHAYRLVEAAQTVQALHDGAGVSHGRQINERTVRELAPFAKGDLDAARHAWRVLREIR